MWIELKGKESLPLRNIQINSKQLLQHDNSALNAAAVRKIAGKGQHL